MSDPANGKDLLHALVAPEVRALRAYHVAPAGDMIKLDAMENPYGLPGDLVPAWLERLGRVPVNRYPDPACTELRSALHRNLGLGHRQALVFGNGSDELIQVLVTLVGGPGRSVLSPEPGFSMYRQICTALKTRFVAVPLEPDFSMNRERFMQAMADERPACIFLAYPNNPTGNCFPGEFVNAVLDHAPGLVVLDEAYYAFCGESWMDQVGERDNLVVLRTLSKSGLAGLRLGMLVAGPRWAQEVEKLRLPYNINALTQASALFCLEHAAVLDEQARAICAGRATLYDALRAMAGVQAFPSRANFILMRVDDAPGVFEDLKTRGVLIRNLHQPGTLLENCLRVTVGTEAENRAFLDALEQSLRR